MKKTIVRFSRNLVLAILLLSGLQLMADQPLTKPPRGHAYGYYLKDGTYVLFIYEEDGTRSFSLSQSRPKVQYRLDCSDDTLNWQNLTTMTVGSDGTAQYVDAMPNIPHRYYQVTRVK